MSAKTVVLREILPVVKKVQVPLSVREAFHLFTDQVGSWWPLDTHSVFGNDAAECALEGWVGGRFYETHKDGRTSVWGEVLDWSPPDCVEFTMHPGREVETCGQVKVTFEEQPGGTVVTLTHSGWDRLGENGSRMRNNYDLGWDHVLGKFVASIDRVN